ncbi:MAG: HD domain-containing protein [Ruminococcaceae bacterium]|nr:HD domain-containing protein [Oscillospiraceae bacterium]
MNFTPIDNSERVEGYCLIRAVEKKTGKNGEYLDVTLCDSDGEINGKLWRYSAMEHGEYSVNEIVKVRGIIRPYNGVDQLNIERIRPVVEADNVSIDDFIKTADYSGEQMYNELFAIASGFVDEDLKKIVTTILSDNRLKLLYWPAAFKLHHAIRGGLLMHTLSIVRLAQGVCKIYPFVDRELLLAGTILHDISKLEEFEVSEAGVADGYSIEGNLLGHIAMGAVTISKYADRLGINPKTSMLLQHMILSHHGEPEFGAAVRPMFIEAELLSELDLMDSRVYEMKEAVSAAKDGDFSQRVWALDNRRLYNHSRASLEEETKLF